MISNNFNIKELLKHHGTPRLYLSDRLSLLDSFNLKNAELIIIWWAYLWRFLSWWAPALMQQSELTRSSEAQCSQLLMNSSAVCRHTTTALNLMFKRKQEIYAAMRIKSYLDNLWSEHVQSTLSLLKHHLVRFTFPWKSLTYLGVMSCVSTMNQSDTCIYFRRSHVIACHWWEDMLIEFWNIIFICLDRAWWGEERDHTGWN